MTIGALTTVPARPAKAALGLVLAAMLLTGCLSPNAQSFLTRTNDLRASRGVPALASNEALNSKAQAWAATIAAKGALVHSDLPDGLSAVSWTTLGENLASGTESGDWAARLHAALVRSPVHYANLVDRRFTHMGIGIASANGKVFVVEVFAQIQ